MQLLLGDCLVRLKELESNSVDAIVCDPPYGLSFMGKKWDYDVPRVQIWKECLRVLKPGGYLLAFAGTRTQHRMAVNIEDAGFEIRDMIAWVYGSGFPKSLNIGKAVDKIAPRLNQFDEFAKHLTNQIQISGKTQKEIASLFPSKTGRLTGCVWNWANGANVPTVAQWNILKPLLNLSDEFMPLIERVEREREVVGKGKSSLGGTVAAGERNPVFIEEHRNKEFTRTKGTSEWEGWGTALKPALEPITVARKPIEGTVAENCLKWGVGGINIDGCRVEAKKGDRFGGGGLNSPVNGFMGNTENTYKKGTGFRDDSAKGRFPANLIHDGSEEVMGLFPDNKGAFAPVKEGQKGFGGIIYGKYKQAGDNGKTFYGDGLGSAARFFYCAKASKRERNIGCEGLEKKERVRQGLAGEHKNTFSSNSHPTVKPLALMEYLVKLVSREGHTVLDPFMGSGTTGMACKKLNREFIGMEMMPEYMEIAKARIEGVKKEDQLNMI